MAKKQTIVVIGKKKKKTARSRAQGQPTAVGKALRVLGSAGGGVLGAYLGQPSLGGAVGNTLGAALSRWLGQGDYTVNTNSIVTASASTNIPAMHKTLQSVTVRHREYLGVINGSIDYKLQASYPLNPGMSQTFPWLSVVATQFSEYKIKGMVFHYVPTSGNAVSSTNAALGAVMIQTTYRATEPAPVSKVEMLNEYWASEGSPASSFVHPIECNPAESPYTIHYTRSGTPADNLLWYDLGKTFVATQGMQVDNQPIGDLWVTYEVELKKPVVRSELNGPLWAESTGNTVGDTVTDLFEGLTNTGLIQIGKPAPNTITFPPGTSGSYLLVYAYSTPGGTITALTAPTFTPTNCTIVSAWTPGYTSVSHVDGVTSYVYWIRVSDPTQESKLVAGGFSSTITVSTTNVPWTMYMTQFRS
jgi:hypothetical protein